MGRLQWVAVVAVALLALQACGSGADDPATATSGEPAVETSVAPAATPANGWEIYDPVRSGEPVPAGYRPVLARDDIAPIYDPRFVEADDAGWQEDSLVIGVDLGGVAKAYPVAYLGRREMVIDSHNGIPTLVTW